MPITDFGGFTHKSVPPVPLNTRTAIALEYVTGRIKSCPSLRPVVNEVLNEIPPLDFDALPGRRPVLNVFPIDSQLLIQGSGRGQGLNYGGTLYITIWIVIDGENASDSSKIWDTIVEEFCGKLFRQKFPELWDKGISSITVYQPATNPTRAHPEAKYHVATGILSVRL